MDMMSNLKNKMIMKNENNYYTPSIEEFHVGFEYEEYDNL